MKEARIECVIAGFPVHDLGLTFRQGDVAFVEAEQARSSSDLGHAIRIGAVRVRYVQRAQTVRKASPSPRTQMAHKPPTPPRPPPPPNVRLPRQRPMPMSAPQGASMEDMKVAAAEAARDAALEATRKTSEEVAELKALLVAALGRPVQVVSPTSAPVSGPAAFAEPVFIPERIVDKDATIQVKSESTEAGDLDATAAALKQTTGRRGRKKKEADDGG